MNPVKKEFTRTTRLSNDVLRTHIVVDRTAKDYATLTVKRGKNKIIWHTLPSNGRLQLARLFDLLAQELRSDPPSRGEIE